ncbi:anti-sigma-I factor RsgI family protein [Anaerosolibacter sp.]|uniref:anti-sigma-I factor RsgI family protein n=1 Tax=Anaerosolibacter sp. TaxID=1872527 RepID=UPI0039F100BC
MVYRGCVVKLENDFAVVLTSTMEYQKVVKKDGLEEGKEIIFVHEDIYRRNKVSIRTIGLAAAMFLMMFISMTWLNPWSTTKILANTAAVVSIDINPSVELEINQEQEVLKVIPINEDGKKVVSEELLGMAIDEAVLAIVDRAKALNYLTEERNTVLISTTMTAEKVSLDGKEIVGRIEQKLEEKIDLQEIQVAYLEGKKEDVEKARVQHVSIGKYGVLKKAEADGEQITVEEIKELKAQQILDKGVGKLRVKELKKKKSSEEISNQDIETEDKLPLVNGKQKNHLPGQETAPGLKKAPGLEKAPGQLKKVSPSEEEKKSVSETFKGEKKNNEQKKNDGINAVPTEEKSESDEEDERLKREIKKEKEKEKKQNDKGKEKD